MENDLPISVITSIPDQNQLLMDQYFSILEKTNQQLSLWSNPYGVMVGVLTFLVAAGAIIFAFILWKLSNDQRDFLVEQKKKMKEANEGIKKCKLKYDKQIKEHKLEYDKQIKESEEKMKVAKEEQKKDLQDKIDELKRERVSIGLDHISDSMEISRLGSYVSPVEKSLYCSKCSKFFSYTDSSMDLITSGVISGNEKKHCIFCGEEITSQLLG